MALSLNDWFLEKPDCSTRLPPSTGVLGISPQYFLKTKPKKILPSFSISCLPTAFTWQLEILVIALVVNNYFVSLESQCFLRQILERQKLIPFPSGQVKAIHTVFYMYLHLSPETLQIL